MTRDRWSSPRARRRRARRRGRHRLGAALLHGRGLVGLVLVGSVVLLGVLAPLLAPYGPNEQIAGANLLGRRAPRTGSAPTRSTATSCPARSTASGSTWSWCSWRCRSARSLGGLLGLISSAWSGVDVVTQRVFDLVLAFPTLILAIALTAFLGPGLLTVAVVIMVAEIPVFGRLVRTLGAGGPRAAVRRVLARHRRRRSGWVLRKHVLPNSLEPLIVQLALSMSVAVFIEGAMSFLGIGVRPPDPSLGSLIKDGMRNDVRRAHLRRRTARRRRRAGARVPARRPGAVEGTRRDESYRRDR